MPRTGKRANALRSALEHAGAVITHRQLPRPRLADVRAAELEPTVVEVYRALGGQQSPPRVQTGQWDLEVDGVAVELDEDLHFNHYRRLTLESPLYERLNFPRDLYRRLCDEHESDCLAAGAWGKRWSKPRAEIEFGAAGAPGDLSGSGAARWKQRAFYDFIKDMAPLTVGVQVSRVPVWETITFGSVNYPVGVALERLADGLIGVDVIAESLLARVQEHTFGLSGSRACPDSRAP